MIKEFEKIFFHTKFEKIKKHPRLKHLTLNDEEIIKYRYQIKSILEFHKSCSEEHQNCKTFLTHYEANRNRNNVLTFTKYICKKQKIYWEIPDDEINEIIKKHIFSNHFKFTNEDACNAIQKISSTKYDHSYQKNLLSDLKHVGFYEWKQNNRYLLINEQKQDVILLYAYLFILKEQNTAIVRAWDLNSIIKKSFTSFQVVQEFKYMDNLLKIQNLIIVDIGHESTIDLVNYYLDYLYEFLFKRHKKNLTTIIITDISWIDIIKRITTHKNFQKQDKVMIQKIRNLEEIFKQIFTTPT